MSIGSIKIKNEGVLIDRETELAFPDVPLHPCPRCSRLLPDFDGFGVIAHVGVFDNYPLACGYCTHPASDFEEGKGWVCGICGAVKCSPEWDRAKSITDGKGLVKSYAP